MEASGTPTPAGDPAGETPPPPPTASAEPKASGGWRALAVLLCLALAFASAVMVIAMLDIADTPLLDDCQADPSCTEYFDGSSFQKTATLVLGWPSAVLTGIAALFSLYFAATGRHGRTLLQLTGAAIVLGALSIAIGSV